MPRLVPALRSAALLAALAAPAVWFLGTMLSRVVDAGPPPAPALLEPAPGAALGGLTPTFRWRSPSGATQAEFELIPEGPAAALRTVTPDEGAYTIPPRDTWCCLRRGFSYRWRVRTTDAVLPLLPVDPYWSPWAEGRFTVEGQIEN